MLEYGSDTKIRPETDSDRRQIRAKILIISN